MRLECSACGFRCTWAAAVTPFPVMAAQTTAHASNADLSGRRPRPGENPCGPDSRSTREVVIGSHTLQVLSYALRRIWRPGRLGIAVRPGRLGLGMGSVCLLRSAPPCQRDPQLAGGSFTAFLRALGTEGWLGWSRSWAMLPLRTRCPASRGSLLGAGTGGSDAPPLRSPTARRLLAGDGNGTLIAATSYA